MNFNQLEEAHLTMSEWMALFRKRAEIPKRSLFGYVGYGYPTYSPTDGTPGCLIGCAFKPGILGGEERPVHLLPAELVSVTDLEKSWGLEFLSIAQKTHDYPQEWRDRLRRLDDLEARFKAHVTNE